MSWVAVAVGAGSAVVGAYSANKQAKAANKSKTEYTDQTSTESRETLPYAPTIDHLNQILAEQARLYGEGSPDYQRLLELAQPRGGGGGGGGVGARGDEAMELYRQIAERGLAAGSSPGVGFGMDAIGGIWGGDPTGAPRPEGGLDPKLVQSAQRFGGDYNKALKFARNNPESILGRNLAEREAAVAAYDQQNPGAGAGTGFEGYNPILADLARELGGSSMDIPMDLLMQFLGENNRSGGGGPEAATAGGNGAPGAAGGGGGEYTYRGGGGGGYYGGGGGGGVPDTGVGQGTFQRDYERIVSEEANEEEIAALLEGMAGDIKREGSALIADLEARASGSGRFNGSWHAGRLADAKRAQTEELAQVSAQLRYGDLEQRRQARLRALEILNSRDLGALSAEVQREGIAASSGSAAAGRDLARELAELENSRALRGQDLSAIGALMQGEQFGLSGLMGMGERLSADRLSSLSLIPGFENLNLAGLDRSLGAAGGMAGLEGIDASARAQGAASRNAAAEAAANRRFQVGLMEMESPQRMLNDYLRTVGAIGGMGGTSSGTSHTAGTNVVPGAGISTGAATAQGALGGALTGLGIAGQYGAFNNSGGGGSYPTNYYGTPID